MFWASLALATAGVAALPHESVPARPGSVSEPRASHAIAAVGRQSSVTLEAGTRPVSAESLRATGAIQEIITFSKAADHYFYSETELTALQKKPPVVSRGGEGGRFFDNSDASEISLPAGDRSEPARHGHMPVAAIASAYHADRSTIAAGSGQAWTRADGKGHSQVRVARGGVSKPGGNSQSAQAIIGVYKSRPGLIRSSKDTLSLVQHAAPGIAGMGQAWPAQSQVDAVPLAFPLTLQVANAPTLGFV